jgi:hypothetical protein
VRLSRRAAVAAGMLATALVCEASARADDEVHGDLLGYYGGERLSAYVVGGMGAAAAAGGGYLVTRDSDFARGLGWPWLVMGGLETVGAVFYGFQVGGEIDHYEGQLARDPATYRAEEIDHLRGTSSRFVVYRAVELGLTLGGAGAAGYGLATNRDAWKGAGVGVASLALPFFVIDTLNDARASRYLDEVRRYQPQIGVQPVRSAGGGWMISMAGRF